MSKLFILTNNFNKNRGTKKFFVPTERRHSIYKETTPTLPATINKNQSIIRLIRVIRCNFSKEFFVKKIKFLFLILLLPLLAACDSETSQAGELSERPIRAVATIGMIGDIVENVGGERIEVTSLMGPGVDPHLYNASAGDVTRMAEADIIFYNGLHLEAKMADVLEQMDGRVRTVAVTNRIERDVLLAPPEFEGNYDPHVWFDVTLWMAAAEQVRDALVELDPDSTQLYQDNAAAYLADLADLDSYVREQAGRVPEQQRVLITAHDAFNYFGRAYGFEVRGLQGISTAAEAGTADVQGLAAFIIERQIPAVFVESSVPSRYIEAVQAAVNAQGEDISIGGELFSDAMGSTGTAEGTYNGMVRHNIDTIVGALLGQ
jgi:manganese/zinc/iron transport system substrate-binding protein